MLPDWIRTRYSYEGIHDMKHLLRRYGLSTVCEEARCPNKSECFRKPTATFMILGSLCTRGCSFCSVDKGLPFPPETDEPLRVSLAAKEMGLKYIVLTSPTRDDLFDGGAGHFRDTVLEVKRHISFAKVEVLTPDFMGSMDSLRTVISSCPDVFNHNVETVPSLYPEVRHQANYERSLNLLYEAKKLKPHIKTKSGLMLGFGESFDEVLGVFHDLKSAGCEMITIGQYLQPSKRNLPVKEYVLPKTFERLKDLALDMGFNSVASSPLVRSSMNAEEVFSNVAF
ncbi:MAG: lipoyl synthase [Nitrospirae bacterium]|nr:lipoyl synthase [Nitrospirota bacterium]